MQFDVSPMSKTAVTRLFIGGIATIVGGIVLDTRRRLGNDRERRSSGSVDPTSSRTTATPRPGSWSGSG